MQPRRPDATRGRALVIESSLQSTIKLIFVSCYFAVLNCYRKNRLIFGNVLRRIANYDFAGGVDARLGPQQQWPRQPQPSTCTVSTIEAMNSLHI